MLDQLARHGQMDLELKVNGDLEVDEHHTIEDTALALGEAFDSAIGDKMGMERYGFCLPMDDCLARSSHRLWRTPLVGLGSDFQARIYRKDAHGRRLCTFF